MLLKVKTVPISLLLIFTFALTVLAQTILPVNAPSSAEIMRERIAKAKAYIVIKNYNAAIYELENIKRESGDPALDSVINVLLMNSFLEQGDYKRAQDFLSGIAKDQKAAKPNAAANYFAVAAQVIRCSRTQLERYHSMGLNVSDRTLPEAAAADVEKMRATLEMVVDQSKELAKDKKYMDSAIALLDGATTARGNLAKDDYDANRWKLEAGDAREEMANSRSTIINAVGLAPVGENSIATASTEPKPNDANAVLLPVSKDDPAGKKGSADQPVSKEPSGETVAKVEKPALDPPRQEAKKDAETGNNSSGKKRDRTIVGSAPKTDPAAQRKDTDSEIDSKQQTSAKDDSPMEVGSLIDYATKKANPVYPVVARNMRMTGVVKVEVLLGEDGKVFKVQNTNGPSLLQGAAQDAIRKWQFTPFKRDGEPVKAVGFVSFSFNL